MKIKISGKCRAHKLVNCPTCNPDNGANKIIRDTESKFKRLKLKRIKKPDESTKDS